MIVALKFSLKLAPVEILKGFTNTLFLSPQIFPLPTAPEPPTMLQCSQVPSDPLSYSCNWMAPAVTNGMLSGYELECLPGLEGILPPPIATPSMTSATVSGLRNGVNYTCTVRARNEGGLSLASAPTLFYIMEIGIYYVEYEII